MIRRRNNILIVLVRRRKRFENIVNYRNVAPVGGEPLPESIVKTRDIDSTQHSFNANRLSKSSNPRENSCELSFRARTDFSFVVEYNEILGIIFERR